MQSNYSGAPVVEADAATVDALLEGVCKNALLTNTPRIREYLLQFVDLSEVVSHAVEAAKQHFPEAQLVLEVYRDPEIDDEYLALYVRLSRYDNTVMERIAAQWQSIWTGLRASRDGFNSLPIFGRQMRSDFDWREYLELAKAQAGMQTAGYSQEAAERSAVSRAYYTKSLGRSLATRQVTNPPSPLRRDWRDSTCPPLS